MASIQVHAEHVHINITRDGSAQIKMPTLIPTTPQRDSCNLCPRCDYIDSDGVLHVCHMAHTESVDEKKESMTRGSDDLYHCRDCGAMYWEQGKHVCRLPLLVPTSAPTSAPTSTSAPDKHVYVLVELERNIACVGITHDIVAILASANNAGSGQFMIYKLSPRLSTSSIIMHAILVESGGRIGDTAYMMCDTGKIDALWNKYVK